MKTSKIFSIALLFSVICLSCSKSQTLPPLNEVVDPNVKTEQVEEGGSLSGRASTTAVCNSDAYIITLEEVVQTGSNWEWIWSVQNPNPGNGTGGTVQNLSHWGMQFAPCINTASIVGAAYSADNISWTSFAPNVGIDPSQGCFTAPVFKFDFGTTGSNKSYYKLVVNQQYVPGPSVGYFKSGNRTGCCTFSFPGLSCGGQFEE